MHVSLAVPLLVAGILCVPAALAWGAAGHEIVATIAQIYLHDSTLKNICTILAYTSTDPDAPQCHLAPIAAWADRYKYRMRWSAALHYVGAVGDHPSQTCKFPGDHGWRGAKGVNVLGGIRNTTRILSEWGGESDPLSQEALKFLVHFIGDLHMPLHLTGRDRGGNSVKVRFDGRQTNLHSLWDGLLIAKALRSVPRNYSSPLSGNPRVEFALRDTIYDSWIRQILWEGLLHDWNDEIDDWLSCPTPSPQGRWRQLQQGIQSVLGIRHHAPEETDDDVVCPYHWAKDIHKLNCELVWPKELDEPPYGGHSVGEKPVYLELDTLRYSGVIAKERVLERLLAQAGIRLAATLNWLFADEQDGLGVDREWI